ncbi:MAG: filamentous hemagglutinin N-terminal domain-containing protein, partial [Burkholderiales bacterium]|nr:filamentous hemagglutinin N-terminal domain-containing protein [Burkholderiales bacterium]
MTTTTARWMLRPLVAALAASLPLYALAQSRVTAPPPPPPKTLPVPAAGWRVYGNKAETQALPTISADGRAMLIQQNSQRAIYAWQSFDIGADASVTFDMAQAGSSALNRIGSVSPSLIFGQLKATNGGEILLYNRNGILFGKDARVDVGALMATTLAPKDADYANGFVTNITGGSPALRYDGAAADYVDAKNFIRVEPGALITTGEGGRIQLYAKRVENAGTLTAPGGQVVLGAGAEVFYKLPTAEPIYASEANPNVPALRGLLVEVGRGDMDSGAGSVEHTGSISVPRGNATLVGLAVNQAGRISATTSVSQNGSILLLAQGDAGANRAGSDTPLATSDPDYKRPVKSGTLTLAAGSVTEITPDNNGADGKPLTSDDNASFTRSRLQFAGSLIDVQGRVIAPSAQAEFRALDKPNFDADLITARPLNTQAGRLLIGSGANVDLSGTTDTMLSAARNFVTTELLGSNDLKDAPLQKDGLLYRNKVTLDIRQASPILGDLASYRAGLQRSATERLSSGGSLKLIAGDAVLAQSGSSLKVDGGKVTYTDALVAPTQLYSNAGTAYTLNTAPKDLVYTAVTNAGTNKTRFDRWGPMVGYGVVSPARLESGYVDGQAGGSLTLIAPSISLNGQLHGSTALGARQRLGQDALPATAQLVIGALQHVGAFGSSSYAGAVLGDFELTAADAAPAAGSGLSLDTLRQSGFGSVSITAVGGVKLAGDLDLPSRGVLRLQSEQGTVDVAGSVHAASGQLTLRSLNGDVKVAEQVHLDVAGAWVNAALDPLLTASAPSTAITGGSLNVQAGGNLTLGSGSVLDVSGGGLVSGSQTVSGGAAGNITLAAGPTGVTADTTPRTLDLGAELRGYSLTQGGSLSLAAPALRFGGTSTAPDAPGTLRLDAAFLNRGGFQSLAFDGRESLLVETGTTLAPRLQLWQATAASRFAPSGSRTADLFTAAPQTLTLPKPVNLSLASSGYRADLAPGQLDIAAGAGVSLDPTGRLDLSARNRLRVDGSLVASGGQVNLSLKSDDGAANQARNLWLGSTSRIDVAGLRQLQPSNDGLLSGRVLAGGSISLDAGVGSMAYSTSLVVQQGARLDIGGAAGLLDVRERADGGDRVTRQLVGSAAGSLAVRANGLLLLEGDLHAQAGTPDQNGGRLQVRLEASYTDPSLLPPVHELVLGATDGQLSAALTADGLGRAADVNPLARVDAPWAARAGITDLSLSARERIAIEGGVSLNLGRALTLDSTVLAVTPLASQRAATLSAPLLSWANTQAVVELGLFRRDAALPTTGSGRLSLQAGERLDVSGQVVSQGISQLQLASAGDLLLQKPNANVAGDGRLATAADLALSARQIFPASDTAFTIDASGQRVDIAQPAGDAPDLPWSAGGRLMVNAKTIVQGGRLRAPEGSLTLRAGESLQLLAGSETSVNADGRSFLFGSWNGERWQAPGSSSGSIISAAPAKAVLLDAPQLSVAPGAKLDLSGGGQLLGWQFVAGPGGSTDIFSAADGSYAIVPGVRSSGAADNSLPGLPALGRQINFGNAGLTLPDGTVLSGSYTLLPARFALLPGALLVRPTSGTALSLGRAVTRDDGSLLVGAKLGQAGTTVLDALTSNWQLLTPKQAQRYSEIRLAGADAFFGALAVRNDAATPALNRDAGALVVTAQQADIRGALRFAAAKAATGEVGQGGSAYFGATDIRVGAGPADTGILQLGSEQLNALGVDKLVIGAVPTDLQHPGNLDVRALNLSIGAEPGLALTAPTLLLAARQRLDIGAGAALQAQASTAGSAAGATTLNLSGDGAAVLLSARADTQLLRSGATLNGGRLEIDDKASLQAIGGRVQLDATGSTQLAGSAALNAAALGIGVPRLQLGGSQALADNSLLLGGALLGQLGGASELLLRSYSSLDLVGALDFASSGHLTLDTPALLAATAADDARLSAQSLVLLNSTGRSSTEADANGKIALTSAGALQIAAGSQAWQAGSTQLTAPGGVILAGNSQVSATGNLSAATSAISANADGTAPAHGQWTVQGRLQLLNAAATGIPTARGAAAQLTLAAQSIDIATDIDLPAGQLVLNADGDLNIGAGRLSVAGRSDSITSAGHSVRTDLAAGSLSATSANGDLTLAGAARLDVSGAGDGDAGRLSLNAPQGRLTLAGELRASASDAAVVAASLSVDASHPGELDTLAQAIAGAGQRAFEQQITVRSRSDDLSLGGRARLAARSIELSADTGTLAVAGELTALPSRSSGGQIQLNAGQDLVIADGARLVARSAGSGSDVDASRIALNSANG